MPSPSEQVAGPDSKVNVLEVDTVDTVDRVDTVDFSCVVNALALIGSNKMGSIRSMGDCPPRREPSSPLRETYLDWDILRKRRHTLVDFDDARTCEAYQRGFRRKTFVCGGTCSMNYACTDGSINNSTGNADKWPHDKYDELEERRAQEERQRQEEAAKAEEEERQRQEEAAKADDEEWLRQEAESTWGERSEEEEDEEEEEESSLEPTSEVDAKERGNQRQRVKNKMPFLSHIADEQRLVQEEKDRRGQNATRRLEEIQKALREAEEFARKKSYIAPQERCTTMAYLSGLLQD